MLELKKQQEKDMEEVEKQVLTKVEEEPKTKKKK
jgi:hypothetical protein